MVMARVLGIPVEQHDDCSRPRMHDFRFTLPDGRSGAAEMTSVTDPADPESLAAARFPRHVPNTTWAFSCVAWVSLSPAVRWSIVQTVIAPIAEARDQQRMNSLTTMVGPHPDTSSRSVW